MTPIFFEGRFGWLHRPAKPVAGGDAPRLGVVLCAAFGQEEICTHHGLMHLAERLSAAGMPTLRFDHRGTGDSADVPLTLDALQADVVRAVDCLRQTCGVDAVAICGLRLGAAIATRAAAAIAGVAGVVLLAPVVSGQAFLRETRAAASVASLSMLDPVPRPDSGLPLNTNGFHWSGAFQVAIGGIDLGTIDAPAPHVLMMPIRADRRAATLAGRWRDRGAVVTEQPFVDYDIYMQDPTTHALPLATFAAVEAWLAQLPVPATAPTPPPTPTRPVTITDTLSIDTIEEVPLRFGDDGRVFGMLCRPRDGSAAPIAALLLHEGSSHHIGNGRAYVALARQLATAGIASLRLDLKGMGDSPAAPGDRNPHYDPLRQADVRAGIDRLEEAGYPKAVSFGLCSGAHTALQAALNDDRVVGTIVINLQKFIWHYGDDIRVAVRNNKRTLRSYMRSLRNPGEWRRALSGQADLVGIARVLGRRGIDRTAHLVRSLAPPAPGSELARVREQMQRLARRRVHSWLMFSDEDPGLAEMTRHFGHRARRLAGFAPARMAVLARADHHFNGTDARRRYRETVETAMRAIIAEHGASPDRPAPAGASAAVGIPVEVA